MLHATSNTNRLSSLEINLMKYILSLLALTLIVSSCTKETEEKTHCFKGVVKWVGSPAADGLGWVIYEDDSITTQPYIPQNLSNDFQKDGLKISVCLKETEEKFYCFCIQPLTKYRVTSIQHR